MDGGGWRSPLPGGRTLTSYLLIYGALSALPLNLREFIKYAGAAAAVQQLLYVSAALHPAEDAISWGK